MFLGLISPAVVAIATALTSKKLFINIMQEKINMTPETKHVGNLLEE